MNRRMRKWLWAGAGVVSLYAVQVGFVLHYAYTPYQKYTTPEGIQVGLYQEIDGLNYIPGLGAILLAGNVYTDNESCELRVTYQGQVYRTDGLGQEGIVGDHIVVMSDKG